MDAGDPDDTGTVCGGGGNVMYKLLIAEDESEMRNLLVKYIRRVQPDLEVVASAVNGKEALAFAREFRPDIVLTDISMPVMDGLEFLKAAFSEGILQKAVIISGYDEFEYARKAIALGVSDYLLKPFDPQELSDVLDKVREELGRQKVLLDNMQLLKEKVDVNETLLREQILRDIILGKRTECPDAEILDTAAAFYCVCLLKLPLYQEDGRWKLDCQENVEELVQVLSDGCIHKDISVQGLSFEENGAILLLSGNAQKKNQFYLKVKNGIEHLQKSMEKYYDVRLICVVGGIYEEWTNMHLSYEETLAVWKGLTSTDQWLIFCEEEKENPAQEKNQTELTGSSKKIQKLKEQILLSVRIGKEEESMRCLDELIQVYASLAPRKTDFVAISAEELVYAIFNEIEQNHIRLDAEKTNEEIQRQIKQKLHHASLLEIKELLKNYFALCHKPFLEHKDRQQSEVIVEHIKSVIEYNLEKEDLTLEWIAEQMHFSSTYIRQLFKQKTGERVMEYVIRKRMEKAAELLLKTDLKIQEIAVACGYSSQRYFASSFKKYYDSTPTEFKAMMSRLN